MKSTVTNAVGITVLEPIDNNYKTGGGDINISGCLVYATKGKPFEAMKVYGNTSDLTDYFGTPLPKKSEGMEGLRHVQDATEGCSYVQVIRVVDDSYRFPAIAFLLTNNEPAAWKDGKAYRIGDLVTEAEKTWICAEDHKATAELTPGTEGGNTVWLEYKGPVETSAHRYNDQLVASEGYFLIVYPVDGDASKNRKVRITDVDTEKHRFTLEISDVDSSGEEYVLESHEVGVTEDDKDDMGLSAYAETVLERDSKCFRVALLDGIEWADIETALLAVESTRTVDNPFAFVGGVSGGYPDTQTWLKGVQLLRNERMPLNMIFAAGIYDADVITAMADCADFRHIAFFYDIPGSLKYDEAIEWNQTIGLRSRHARAYYCPYSAHDIFRDGQTVWGVSGAAATARARGNSIQNTKSVWGVHYSPAGEKRGYLSRTNMVALFPDDVLDRDALYDARINPVVDMAAGGCNIDDDMTQWFQTNYLRFGWINDVLDYIDHRFVEGASQLKFEPQGLTLRGLQDMLTQIMEDLVTSEALVVPTDTAKDGTDPYIIRVKQEEKDYFSAEWEVCISGAARRIAGQPMLIR